MSAEIYAAQCLAQCVPLSECFIESRSGFFYISMKRLLALPVFLTEAAAGALAFKWLYALLAPDLGGAQGVECRNNVVRSAIEFCRALIRLLEKLLFCFT